MLLYRTVMNVNKKAPSEIADPPGDANNKENEPSTSGAGGGG